MILVTGATGLVGSHLLCKLVLHNKKVRAIKRENSSIDEVKEVFDYYFTDDCYFNAIEWVTADITDVTSLITAFKGATKVYHCAALVSFNPKDYHTLRKVNIEGTANIVNLCIANAVEKLCYVSSIATIGKTLQGNCATEETYWTPGDSHSAYAITKYGAEMEVWRGTKEGVDAVIVNPGIILGGGFWGKGSSALFTRVKKGMPYYTEGTTGFVDVEDVVEVMMRLMDGEIKNERYIVVAKNMPFRAFFTQVANSIGTKVPTKSIQPWQLSILWRLDALRCFFTGKNRKLTKATAQSAFEKKCYNADKIKSELDFSFKPVALTIKEVGEKFRQETSCL